MAQQLKVSINHEIRVCDCCGKKNLKRTLKLKGKGVLYLGVTCGGKWFNLNLSGNPYQAATRLENYINNNIPREDFEDLFEGIRENAFSL